MLMLRVAWAASRVSSLAATDGLAWATSRAEIQDVTVLTGLHEARDPRYGLHDGQPGVRVCRCGLRETLHTKLGVLGV